MQLTFCTILLAVLVCCLNINHSNCQSISSPNFDFLPNVSYAPHPQQIMDIYLPADRNATSPPKVILLVHGGGWCCGSKEDMNGWINFFFSQSYAVATMGYRLGSIESPGFPKQIQDIELAIRFLIAKSEEYIIEPIFGLVGSSAGGHLSMLYGYAYNASDHVHVICNLVGPSSLVDPNYVENPVYDALFLPLLGNTSFAENPWGYYLASPIAYANAASPKTISFYGDSDELIPSTQGAILEDKLDSVGVYNKFYLYQGGGHGNFTAEQLTHMYKKMTYFFDNYM